MKKIIYEEYALYAEKRLSKVLYRYACKSNFMKPTKYYDHLFDLFKRYMQDDIFIKWDMER